MPIFSAESLRAFAESLLEAGGAEREEATVVAESLVQANLRGHDSHGVMRLPSYIERVQSGGIKAGAKLDVVHEAASAIVCDGNWGFGQVLSQELTNRLIEKARETGIACGTLRQSAHIGRLGEYAEMAAEHGMIAIVCANTHGAAQRVAPVGGKRPRLGTNPLCIGVPGGEEGPFVLDFGTSATAEGKVRVKRIGGAECPPGWLLDPDGQATCDPNKLYGDPPGTILPMGGDQAYKGFGLAFMIEMLCGGLSGGQCAYPDPPAPVGNCAFFIVIAPQTFGEDGHLAQEVRQLEQYVRSVPKIDESATITLPGDPERRVQQEREQSGIALDDGNWQALVDLANSLGVESPSAT